MSYVTHNCGAARHGGARAALLLAAIMGFAAPPATAATFIVTSSSDTDGATCAMSCTLRQAINAANADLDASEAIHFQIGSGAAALYPGQALPTIVHANTTIDGYTQPGSSQNSQSEGDNAVIHVQIHGANAGNSAAGFGVCAKNVIIRGISITGFAQRGIAFGATSASGACPVGSADGSAAEGNFIGLDLSGTPAGNLQGITVFSSQVRIGGTTPAQRNIISGNTGNVVDSDGVGVVNHGADGTQILGNYIGTTVAGGFPASNEANGVSLTNVSDVEVGSDAAPNRIAYNSIGILVSRSATKNSIYANQFFGNSKLAIDLCGSNSCGLGDGVTDNDLNDIDTGANNLQNFPIPITASLSYGQVKVFGYLDIPFTGIMPPQIHSYAIGLYASSLCDSSDHGQGQFYLGHTIIVLTEGQPEFFNATGSSAAIGTQITATATDSANNTSEFSTCTPLILGDGIFKDGFQ